jgi:hypothetical protein
MRKNRFTIARLLGAIVVLAMIFAGLRSGSNDWFTLIYTLVFLTLVYSAIVARYRGAFWHGFAIAGWAYFLIGFGPWIGGLPAPEPQQAVNRNIVTSVVLEIVTGIMYRVDAAALGDALPPTDRASIMISNLRSANRDGICHSALTILFAWVGGFVSRTVAKRGSDAKNGV